jgi:molybdate transport system permease protein
VETFPGTQVISTNIFSHVEAMEYAQAHWLSALMLIFSFFASLALTGVKRQTKDVHV